MMGHTVDTYHDIESVGVDRLRSVYSASGLAIRPKTHVNKIEAVKEMIRALGMNPEQVLARDALVQGAITTQDNEDRQLAVLRKQLKALILSEVSVQRCTQVRESYRRRHNTIGDRLATLGLLALPEEF